MMISEKAAPVAGTTLRANGPVSADSRQAVNAIVTLLRDPMNSGLTRWRLAVCIINGRHPGKLEETRAG